MKTGHSLIPFALGLGLALASLWLLDGGIKPSIAMPALSEVEGPAEHLPSDATPIHYVAITGTDSSDCSTPVSACLTIQYTVDQASEGDEVHVAAGTYTDVQARAGITQVVYISKTVTVQGGYTTTNNFADPPDPDANPTTLDAQRQGRVFYITGDISPTVEGLRITGGDAAGLRGGPDRMDAGGGVYIINATANISNNRVFSNTTRFGGGLYLDSSSATLSGNVIIGNSANWEGGGIYLRGSDATLGNNTVTANTAYGNGGGACLEFSPAVLSGNTFSGNTASGGGGGLFLTTFSFATLSGNTIISNTANLGGGGLNLFYLSNATLINTVVADNRANTGSGLCIVMSSPRLLHTTIARNSGGDGSGVYVSGVMMLTYSTVALTNTILMSHTVGITVAEGNTVKINGVLWHRTSITASQAATATVTVQNQYEGDPAFAPDGYHLTAGSAAIDVGVDAGGTTDIDGEPRPDGCWADIGADEYQGRTCRRAYLPVVTKSYSTSRDVNFIGTVLDKVFLIGYSYLTVEVEQAISGAPISRQVSVGWIPAPSCLGMIGSNIDIGDIVEVYGAHDGGTSVDLCGSEDYYVVKCESSYLEAPDFETHHLHETRNTQHALGIRNPPRPTSADTP